MEEIIICRCEEITKDEIEEAIRNGATSVTEIKRWTRAGMGLCQGRSCKREIERIIAQHTGVPIEETRPATCRQPVRPLNIKSILDQNNQ